MAKHSTLSSDKLLADRCLCFLFFFDDFFGWQRILFTRFGVLQFSGVKGFDTIDELVFGFFLFNGWKEENKGKLVFFIFCYSVRDPTCKLFVNMLKRIRTKCVISTGHHRDKCGSILVSSIKIKFVKLTLTS